MKSLRDNPDSDLQIIVGLRERNPAAMVSLYSEHGRIVYSVVSRIVRNSSEAEEIVQEVFLRVWTRAHLFDGSRGSLSTWVVTVARNLAIDHLRHSCNRDWQHDYGSGGLHSVPECFEFKDRLARVRAAFTKLTEEERMVIEFAYFEGLTQIEIANRMRKPLGTVKTWARRALCALREDLCQDAEQTYSQVGSAHASN